MLKRKKCVPLANFQSIEKIKICFKKCIPVYERERERDKGMFYEITFRTSERFEKLFSKHFFSF